MEEITPAESGTQQTDAPAPIAPPPVAFHELGDEGRREFLKTGKVSADATADAATADQAEPGASTDARRQAASETADHGKKKGKGLDARKQQLQTEIAEMNDLLRTRSEVRRQLDALDARPKQDAIADSSPRGKAQPEQAAYEKYANDPEAPDPEDFSDLRQWGAAMSVFVAEKVAEQKFGQLFDARAQQSAAASQQQHELNEVAEVAEQRITADEAVVPDWRDRMDPRFASIPPSRLLPEGANDSPQSFAKDQIMFESEHPAQLAVFYSDEANMAKLMRMSNGRSTATPQSIMREIAYQDASFRSPGNRVGSQAAASAAKTFTKTPAPPTSLGRRPGTAGDPVDKVINGKGKFSEFMAAMDQKEGVTSSGYFRRS